jgi:hypothetical protein
MEGAMVQYSAEVALAQVEKQIAEAEVYIIRQRRIVAEREGTETDSILSRSLLDRLEEAQSRRIHRRDLLIRELSNRVF